MSLVRVHFESSERPCGLCARLATGQWHVLERSGSSECRDRPPGYVFRHSRCLTLDELNGDPELCELGHEVVTLAPTAAVEASDALQDLSEVNRKMQQLRDWRLLGASVTGDLVLYEYAADLALDA